MDNAIDKTYEEFIDEPFSGVMACPSGTRAWIVPQAGRSRVRLTGNQTIGLANVANSLYAIKRLVFEDEQLTGAQLLHALKTDFSDTWTDPRVRRSSRCACRSRNTATMSTEWISSARDALALVCEELPKYKTRYGRGPIGGVFQASTTTVSSNTPFGQAIGALPDGRKAGTSALRRPVAVSGNRHSGTNGGSQLGIQAEVGAVVRRIAVQHEASSQ